MKIYVVQLKRIRDQYVEFPGGALDIKVAEEIAAEIIKVLSGNCFEAFKACGSRLWKNSKVEVSVVGKKTPFRNHYRRDEWSTARLSKL